MFVHQKMTGRLERSNFVSELSLRCANGVNRAQTGTQVAKDFTVRCTTDEVVHGVTSRLEFESKMALIRKQDAQFLLVVGTALRFVRGFDQHHANRSLNTHGVNERRVELVVRQPNPRVNRLDGNRLHCFCKRTVPFRRHMKGCAI